MKSKSRHFGLLLSMVFLFALAMGAGPGIVLANQPAMWFGFPRLYVWGSFWCAVEVVVVVVAYLTVWREAKADDE